MLCRCNEYSIRMTKYIVPISEYTFNAADGTIDFTFNPTAQEILLITNVTDGITIYNFACEGFTGTLNLNQLDLTFDTSDMEDTDELIVIKVIKDNSEDIATEIQLNTDNSDQTLRNMAEQLKDIKDLLKLILS